MTQAPAFESFKVFDPQQKQGSGVTGLSYWVYHVRARTTLANYNDKDMTRTRRFRDFDWFRTQLCNEYPWCIVPPIPPKTMQGTVEKFVVGAHDKTLLEYRCRALRKFLSRVGAHPHLYNSSLLKDFLEMDDVEWERRTKTPSKVAGPDTGSRGFLSAVADAGGGAIAAIKNRSGGSSSSSTAGGANNQTAGSYTKALSEGSSNPQVWEETKIYVGQLETSITLLRDRLEQLVKRRRDTAGCLEEFGKAFSRVGEVEASMEQQSMMQGGGGAGGTAEGGGLSNALVSVGKHSETLSSVYKEHGDEETKKVVETLIYYQGICDAVKDTLKRLTGFIQDRDRFEQKVRDAEANVAKLMRQADQVKIKQAETEKDDLIAKRDALAKHVINFEILFKEELRRFHREKQYDMKGMLKIFVELQVEYANKMKNKWEELLPTVEKVKM